MSDRRADERSLTMTLRIIFPCLAALVGALSVPLFAKVNSQLFLAPLVDYSDAANLTSTTLMMIPLMVLVSVLSCEAAARVTTKFLPVVFVQTTAIASFVVVMSKGAMPSFPVISIFIASTLSFALGLLSRSFKSAERQQTSRYFELKIKNDELLKTRLALLKQDEADRRILASDLHDQVLNEIKLIKSKMQKLDPASVEDIAAVEKSLDVAAGHIRDVMESLFPSVLENLGLSAALDQLTRDTVQKAKIQGRFVKQISDDLLARLGKVESLLIYRLVQESLNNVVKHAEAKTVRVHLEGEGEKLTVKIADDGKGIGNVQSRDSSSRGLRYMTLRADLIGANLSWEDQTEGTGTVVKIEMTLPAGV